MDKKPISKCDRIELCDRFNFIIKEIMHYISVYNPDDFDIEYASGLVRKLINYNPLDLLDMSHETIWEYRKHIKDSDRDFFLKEDLISKFNVKEHNKNVKEIDIEYIINQVKKTWGEFDESEQKDIILHIKTLLKISAAYRIMIESGKLNIKD